jgi:prolipoprotein diacylglyceryltransferase
LTVFSVLLALGTILGLIWVVYGSAPLLRQQALNAGIFVLFAGLMGGRIAYVGQNWGYFQAHLLEIPQVWLGGMVWPGALAGAILGTFLVAWITRKSVGLLADQLLPLLVSMSVAIWLGCWLVGCAYGPTLEWGLPAKDEWGSVEERLPLQLMAALLTVGVFWGLEKIRNRKRQFAPGLGASLGLGALSLILLGSSLLRADPYPLFNGVRLETWAALICLLFSTLWSALVYFLNRT